MKVKVDLARCIAAMGHSAWICCVAPFGLNQSHGYTEGAVHIDCTLMAIASNAQPERHSSQYSYLRWLMQS